MLKRDLYYEGIPTKSQRDDARYLGDILGRVIRISSTNINTPIDVVGQTVLHVYISIYIYI